MCGYMASKTEQDEAARFSESKVSSTVTINKFSIDAMWHPGFLGLI